MGGSGSGYRYFKKRTVEGCMDLDISVLTRKGLILNGAWVSGTIHWNNVETGEETGSIGYEANTLDPYSSWMRLHYRVTLADGEQKVMDYKVGLVWTRPNYGGRRWWFVCALAVNGKPSWQRVRKLYLPSGGRYFGCRHCYGLTYESCQESHKYDRMYAQLADGIPGLTGKDVERMFKRDW